MVWLARNTDQDTGGQQSTLVVREACPACGSQHFTNNGHMQTGKQNHQWQACGRQCVLHASNRVIHEAQRTLGDRLLRANISPHGLCRAVGVSLRWLMDFMVTRSQALPDQLHVQPVASHCEVIMGRLEAEADERWSFVKQQPHRPWAWRAMDQQTRHSMAFHLGDRRRDSAKPRWANLPEGYRLQATFSTDPSDASTGVMPVARHQAITKDARTTKHLERFKNTRRQRVSRLVRERLAFSKNVENHIGAIRYFSCDDNLARATALPV